MHEVLSGEDIDKLAEKRLKNSKFAFVLEEPQALDIDGFAEFELDATIDYAPLSQDLSILGLSSYNKQEVQVWDADRQNPMRRKVENNTILLDSIFSENSERETQRRFTLGHECGHFLLHRKFEETRNMTVREFDWYCTCTRIDLVDEKPNRLNFQEWQADRYSAALLMPKSTTLQAYHEYVDNSNIKFENTVAAIEFCADYFMELFNVSRKTARIRLNCLVLEA